MRSFEKLHPSVAESRQRYIADLTYVKNQSIEPIFDTDCWFCKVQGDDIAFMMQSTPAVNTPMVSPDRIGPATWPWSTDLGQYK